MRALFWAVTALSLTGCVQQASVQSGTPPPVPGKDEIVVRLAPTDVQQEPMPTITVAKDGSISLGEPKSTKLVKGELKDGKEKVEFYVPAQGPYSTTSAKNDSFENTSTPICVDGNHDGVLTQSETWWSSLPIRLGDEMYAVKQIDPGGSWIRFAKSSSPLAGVVVGKPCPDFSFKTTDGQPVSLADFKGKFLLLDVWSMT